MNRQTAIQIGLAMLALLIGGFAFNGLGSQKKSTISESEPEEIVRAIEVQNFQPTDLPKKIAIDGRLSAYEKINVSAEVTGKLMPASTNFKAGSSFRKGDVLFQIDNKDQLYALYAQRSSLLNAITVMLPDFKFDYPESFSKWESYLNAFEIETPTSALPEASSDKEKLYLSGKNVYNLYYNIKSQEDRLSDYTIRAPFSGVFLSVNVYPGSLVSPSVVLGQIMNTSRYELIAPVAMNELEFVSPGQQVSLYARELNKTWTGRVSRISNQIDQSTQSVPVYITVSGSGLKDGVFVEGALDGNTLQDVVVLPRTAISNDQIWVHENGTVKPMDVQVHSRAGEEVVLGGVTASEEVVVSSINNLYEGQKVKLTNN